jgi:hypothetical protein
MQLLEIVPEVAAKLSATSCESLDDELSPVSAVPFGNFVRVGARFLDCWDAVRPLLTPHTRDISILHLLNYSRRVKARGPTVPFAVRAIKLLFAPIIHNNFALLLDITLTCGFSSQGTVFRSREASERSASLVLPAQLASSPFKRVIKKKLVRGTFITAFVIGQAAAQDCGRTKLAAGGEKREYEDALTMKQRACGT